MPRNTAHSAFVTFTCDVEDSICLIHARIASLFLGSFRGYSSTKLGRYFSIVSYYVYIVHVPAVAYRNTLWLILPWLAVRSRVRSNAKPADLGGPVGNFLEIKGQASSSLSFAQTSTRPKLLSFYFALVFAQ